MGQTLREAGKKLEEKALLTLKEKITRADDFAEIIHPVSRKGTLDILSAQWRDFGERRDTVTAEFVFQKTPDDPDGGTDFHVMITLHDDAPAEYTPELAFALSIINFYIEKGCFALNKPTNLLVYRSIRTFSADTSEEILLRDCIMEMLQARRIAAKYSSAVMSLAEGSLSLEVFLDLVEG